jgi:hypothetical protein
VARDTFAKPYNLLRDLLTEGQRRGEIARQIDFHGLVLQFEWDERLAIKPLLDIFDVLLVAATRPESGQPSDQ